MDTTSAPTVADMGLKAPLPPQGPTVRPAAVVVQGACVTYPNSEDPVLNGLNLNVAEGSIYGLLGASGCGKTTLLTCIVGRRRLDKGSISVLGRTPGEPGSGLPGPTIGYMPQELALHHLFSIEETFKYFGWIAGMSKEKISERMNELITLLDIPKKKKIVGELSGGEQRRVSLGIALLSNAPVLILDEPTVGVDTVLRQNIWNLLLTQTQFNRTTVIVTTHYIEEARQADKVGLMRQGVVLDEDSPFGLLSRYSCSTMEEVFLKLSLNQKKQQQNQEQVQLDIIPLSNTSSVGDTKNEKESLRMENEEVIVNDPALLHSKPVILKGHTNLAPCTWKMFVYMWRNKSIVAVSALIPIVICLLFGYCVGGIPKGLRVAFVNNDYRCSEIPPAFPTNCNEEDPIGLSCRFLRRIKTNDMFTLEEYADVDSARAAAQRGKAWGFMHFPHNYSSLLISRQRDGLSASDYTLENSEIGVHLDMSNKQIGDLLKGELSKSALKYFKEIEQGCERNISIPEMPMKVQTIYGDEKATFRDFFLSALLLTSAFGLISQYTMMAIIDSKKDGFLERSLSAGVDALEILGSHIVVDTIMMCLINASLFFVVCVLMQAPVAGSLSLLVLLAMLNGVSGMFFGYLSATFCQTEYSGIVLYMALNFPLAVLSGLLWPVEGMHPLLRHTVWVLPQNPVVSAGRAIMSKGWGLDKSDVFNGFMLTILWLFIFVSLTIICIRRRKNL